MTCNGDKRIVQRILVGKPEWKWEFKNLKVGGSLRMELILKEQDGSAGVGLIWLSTGTI